MAGIHTWSMVNIQAKKHDNFSVEFKFGFENNRTERKNNFAVNSWIFVPKSISINPESYGKDQFYRDIKSNVRLITPVYSLDEIADSESLPLRSLTNAVKNLGKSPLQQNSEDYEYHLKMFAAIFKSSLRNAEHQFKSARSTEKFRELAQDMDRSCRKILEEYRQLSYRLPKAQFFSEERNYFRMCDEFISHILEFRLVRVLKKINASKLGAELQETKDRLMKLLRDEAKYRRKMGFGAIGADPETNRELVYHYGMLKKFVESDLFIGLDKKKDGVAVEQLYYSLAAGIAMIFATAVAWFSQVKFGNITWPLFLALVISYMMKDRIKELMRYYFAHRLGNKYYDKKARISIGKKNVGFIKEGVDFISQAKTPGTVKKMRNNSATIDDASRIFDEKILLYRKRVMIDGKVISGIGEYPMKGINEIMRLHLNRFTQKMDNPEVPVDHLSANGEISTVKVQKIYYLNVVFQLCQEEESSYRHFRIQMTRNGILKVEEIRKEQQSLL